jgi:hypothetical protein
MTALTNTHVRDNASNLHRETFEIVCKQFEHFKIEQEHPITVATDIGVRKTLYIDIYIPQLKVAKECHGEQHFKPVKHFGGLAGYKNQLINDKLKEKWCNNNQISLVIVRFDDKLTPSFIKRKIIKSVK